MGGCSHPNATSTLTTDKDGRLIYTYRCPDCGATWTVTV